MQVHLLVPLFTAVVQLFQNILMLGTVLLAHGKPTAAGVGAGTLWFVWHGFTSFYETYNSCHKERWAREIYMGFYEEQ
jgi:hypothetical protein